MFMDFISCFTDPRFYWFCCAFGLLYLLIKVGMKIIWIALSPFGYVLSKYVWGYLCNKYRMMFPLISEFGGDLHTTSVSNGKKIPNNTAYATAANGEHASLTWIFLMKHSPLAVIEVCCHEYAHLYLGHIHNAVYSGYDPWSNEREADTWALSAMKKMPLLLKICGILFRGSDLYWNPYTKDELLMGTAQRGAPSFRIQKALYECFNEDPRGVFSRRTYRR